MPQDDVDEDLSALLQHVAKDKRRETRRRLANSAETRRFLDAGIALLLREAQTSSADEEDVAESEPLLRGLSRQRVVREAVNALASTGVTENIGTAESQFRDRWTYVSRFHDDLVNYLFRPGPYRQHLREIVTYIDGELAAVPFGTLVQALSELELHRALTDPQLRVQAALQASMPHHPGVRAGASDQYADLLPRWAAIYEDVANRYGFSLRPGRHWIDVATLLNAIIEGASMRAMVDDQLARLTSGENVLQAAILLMLPSIIEGSRTGDLREAWPQDPSPGDVN